MADTRSVDNYFIGCGTVKVILVTEAMPLCGAQLAIVESNGAEGVLYGARRCLCWGERVRRGGHARQTLLRECHCPAKYWQTLNLPSPVAAGETPILAQWVQPPHWLETEQWLVSITPQTLRPPILVL